MTIKEAINVCKEIVKTNMFNRNTDAEAIEEVLNAMYKSIEESAYYKDLVKLKEKEKQNLKKSLKGQIAVKDTEINKLNKVIDNMAIKLYEYANLGHIGICPPEQENGNYNLDLCKMNLAERNCVLCIKEYFMKEDK